MRPLTSTTLALVCGAACAQEIRFPDFDAPRREWSGARTAIAQTRYLAIRDARAWRALWREHAPEDAVPEVDFGAAMVLAVFNPEWTGDAAFRIARVVPGALSSDLSSMNVFVTTATPEAGAAPSRFAMREVERTRFDFRFYAQGAQKAVSRVEMVARVDTTPGPAPAASLVEAARALMEEHRGASDERKAVIVSRLAAFGEPLRPFWNRLKAAGGADVWIAAEVLARMLADEVAATSKRVRVREVAVAKAIAAVAGRLDVKGQPWYVKQRCRLVDGTWYVMLHGTFGIFSDWETANQPDVRARVALRAEDGRLLKCEIERDRLDVDAEIRKVAPGVVPVGDKQEKKKKKKKKKR